MALLTGGLLGTSARCMRVILTLDAPDGVCCFWRTLPVSSVVLYHHHLRTLTNFKVEGCISLRNTTEYGLHSRESDCGNINDFS